MAPASRTAYFQALGIDVWVRRGTGVRARVPAEPVKEIERPAPPAARQTPRREVQRHEAPPKPVPPPPEPPRREVAPEEAFRIRCFRYGRVFAAITEDAWPMRRFLADVAWALNGFEPAERQSLIFDWPQPGAVADGGGRAFGAFFRYQTRTREGCRVLLAGARVAGLLGHSAPGEACLLDEGLYVPPDAMDAATKQTVWRVIQGLDPAPATEH